MSLITAPLMSCPYVTSRAGNGIEVCFAVGNTRQHRHGENASRNSRAAKLFDRTQTQIGTRRAGLQDSRQARAQR